MWTQLNIYLQRVKNFEMTYEVLSVFVSLATARVDHCNAAVVPILKFVSLSADQCLVQIKDYCLLVR